MHLRKTQNKSGRIDPSSLFSISVIIVPDRGHFHLSNLVGSTVGLTVMVMVLGSVYHNQYIRNMKTAAVRRNNDRTKYAPRTIATHGTLLSDPSQISLENVIHN